MLLRVGSFDHIKSADSQRIVTCEFYNSHDNTFQTQCEPRHDKTNKISVRPAKTQISLGIRPVWSESSLCAEWVAKAPELSSCGQRRHWSDWADAQADLSLRWAHSHIVGFVMSQLMLVNIISKYWFAKAARRTQCVLNFVPAVYENDSGCTYSHKMSSHQFY